MCDKCYVVMHYECLQSEMISIHKTYEGAIRKWNAIVQKQWDILHSDIIRKNMNVSEYTHNLYKALTETRYENYMKCIDKYMIEDVVKIDIIPMED